MVKTEQVGLGVTMLDDEKPCTQEDRDEAKDKLDKLLRHINKVQEASYLLGRKLIDKGEIDLGVRLVSLGCVHDQSKFLGLEWDYLIQGEFNEEAKLVARHHSRTSKHHPEYWGNINLMPRLYVAELVCDWYARSTEFGENIWDYIKEKAMVRYGISPQGKIYKWIKEFLDLLLDKPFVDSPVSDADKVTI